MFDLCRQPSALPAPLLKLILYQLYRQIYFKLKPGLRITLEAYDLDGQLFEIALDDLAGRAVQHEHDHLEGIMFPDRMVEDKRIELDAQIADFEVQFRNQQQRGEYPSDEEIRKELSQLELNLG